VAANFPVSKDDVSTVGDGTHPSADEALSSTDGGPAHHALHQNVGLAIREIEDKVGTGASEPAANTVLTSIDTGTSVWGTVATAMIAADAVTGAKIADDAIDSEHYTDGSIDRVHLAADIIDGTKLADDAVDSEHYVDGSIDRVHLAADIVDGTKIADDSIDSEHYVAGSIDTEHIGDDQVTQAKIAPGAVDTTELAAGAVETAKINDDAVTSAKMAATVAVDTAFSVGTLTAGRALSTNSANAVDFYRSTATTTEGIILGRSDVGGAGSNKFIVYANGDVATSTASYGGISDVRLKDVLGPSGDRLAQINDMEVIKYRLTKTTDDEGNIVDLDVPSEDLLGFSAQQLQTVAPGLVAEDEHGILNVKVSVLIPMLVKAVQELTARLEAVEG
jgi:hypothetical protein